MSTYILVNSLSGISTSTGTNFDSNNNQDTSIKYLLKKVKFSVFKKLLSNELHRKLKFDISKERIENQLSIVLEDVEPNKEIQIIPMPELSENQLQIYLDCFISETDNLDKYAELLSIVKYEQVSPDNFQVKKRLEKLLETQSSYWEDPANCHYSLNKKFKERRFNNFELIFQADIKKLKNINEEINIGSKTNYLQDIVRNTNWVDLNIKSYYFIGSNSNMSQEHITQIYEQIPNEYLKYIFLSNLLISRAHCHLILNNKELLQKSKPIFDKYEIIFKYLMGYAWLTLRSEEVLIKTKTQDNSRFVFDLETVEKLPIYPFSHEDINLNPYACALFDNNLINLPNNCVSLNMMKDYKNYYGLCSKDEFIKRLNIFVNGKNESGILDQIDWSHSVITGSAMTACGMKYNPLMDICKSNINKPQTDADLSLYFLNYYSNSDIDLLCNHESIFDFLDYTNDFITKITKIHGKPKIESVHTGTIIISDEFINFELDNLKKALGKTDIDLKYIKANFSDLNIKSYFYDKYYINWKNEQAQHIKSINKNTNEVYTDYGKMIPKDEFRIYSLDYELEEDTNEQKDFEKYIYQTDIYNEKNNNSTSNKLVAKLSESIRFKVSANNIRPFEIFKTRGKNFFSTISRFHMGFVRAYWNGQTLKCVPSYISAMMLQLTTDYKYFASIRDPIEIINKYRSRGFGIILNDHEKLHMIQYNGIKKPNEENKWIQMYNIDVKNKTSRDSMFGAKTPNHDIFKPGTFFDGLPKDCFQNVNHQVLIDKNTAFASMKNGKLDDLIKLKSITDTGFINPLDINVIRLGWYKMN